MPIPPIPCTLRIALSKEKHARVSMQLPQALNHFNILSHALETVSNLSRYTTLTFSNSVTAIQ